MATEPPTPAAPPQRAYRAACPNCGAPVDFASAASAFAVCSFCRSTLLRDGAALRRIGESAELFDDHSPLQLGTAGRYQGLPFTLVGRLQYRSSEGTWNEWHALFDAAADGGAPRAAWLSEDNGRYVLALDAPLPAPAPPPAAALQIGQALVADGTRWSVASVTRARLLAVQGELPKPPPANATTQDFTVVDLRSERGDVATLDDADPAAPGWSIGRAVALSELALTGLADGGAGGGGGAASEKTLSARGLECPNCGAALSVTLASTQSIVCHQCQAVVDVSQGVGGDVSHYLQNQAARAPLLALGSVGTLALSSPASGTPGALPWQVVGYVERVEVPQSPDDDEAGGWREYLLYHRGTGFAFLVDADDGWSWAVPITGVPSALDAGGDRVMLEGVTYRRLYDYVGRVGHVQGEFYWRLTRDQQTANTDYAGTAAAATAKRLNREQTREGGAQEIVWSAGEALSADAVMRAFRLAPDQAAALQRDVAPLSSAGGLGGWPVRIFLILLVLFIVWSVLRAGGGRSAADCADTAATFGEASGEYQQCLADQRGGTGGGGSGFRTGGGSYGGFSTGGGHK